MARRAKTWIAVLERAAKDGSEPEEQPSFYGIGFPRVCAALDPVASRLGLRPLSEFFQDDSVWDDELANEVVQDRHGPGSTYADMDGDTMEMLPDLIRVYRSWRGTFFPPGEALPTVRGLRTWALSNRQEADGLIPELDAEGIDYVLSELEAVLVYGEQVGRGFRLAPPGPA